MCGVYAGIYLAYTVSSYNKYIAFTYMLRILCVMGHLRDTLYTSTCFYRLDLYVNDLVNQDI